MRTIIDDLSESLCQNGIEAGERMRSERELALRLNWNLQDVRRAIAELVKRGILIRKQGSGTYVRKIPRDLSKGSENRHSASRIIPAEILMADERKSSDRLYLDHSDRGLSIGVWTDLYWHTRSHQIFLASLSDCAARMNHQLAIRSICVGREKTLQSDVLARQLRENPADGYIVPDWCASAFRKAQEDANKPCVFFGGSGTSVDEGPVVFMDFARAIQNAIRRLANSGYKRIALFLLSSPGQSLAEEKAFYSAALKEVGLDYEEVVTSDFSASRSLAAVRKLLDNDILPDAVFIGDDYLLDAFAQVMSEREIQPGRDIGVITLSSKNGHPLPADVQWSSMENDLELLAQVVIEQLISLISSNETRPYGLSLQASWKPGTTHLKEAVVVPGSRSTLFSPKSS